MEFAFQLGEKQPPQLDKLLPDVARQIAFNKHSTKLITKRMGGAVVEWDIQSRQKRDIGNILAKRWFAYSTGANQLLVRKANDNITVLSVGSGDEILLTNGQYESGSLSTDGTLAVLSKGNNEVEVWQLTKQSSEIVKSEGSAQKLKTLADRSSLLGTASRFLMTVNLSRQQKGVTETVRGIRQSLKFGTQLMNTRSKFSILVRF